MGHKISLLVSREDHRREGTRKVVDKLKVGLKERGFDVTSRLVKNAALYHVFSNGFFEAIQYKEIRERAIYSLLANIDYPTKQTFRWFKEAIQERREKDYISQIGKIAVASIIPLDVKRKAIAGYGHITVPTRHLKKTLGIKKARVIPLGIDAKKFQKTGEGDGVAFFGAPATPKGYPDFHEAAKKIDRKVPIRFYFRSREKKMRTLVKGENVEVLGPQKDMVKAYNENSVIVLPFRLKIATLGIPLTLLEAMACERAIVTTNLPHIKEVAGDSALYVDPRAPEQIRRKVETLLDDEKLRRRLGKKARKRVLERYTEKHMLDGFLRLYKEALGKS